MTNTPSTHLVTIRQIAQRAVVAAPAPVLQPWSLALLAAGLGVLAYMQLRRTRGATLAQADSRDGGR